MDFELYWILEQHLLGIGVILRCSRDCEGLHLKYRVLEWKFGAFILAAFLFQ